MSKFWQHFIHDGQPGPTQGYLGLHGYGVPLKRRLASRWSLDQASGVEVQAIEPYSPAEEAGILEGDIMLSLDEKPTPSADELQRLLGQIPLDVPVQVLLLRGDRCLERLVLARPARSPASRRR